MLFVMRGGIYRRKRRNSRLRYFEGRSWFACVSRISHLGFSEFFVDFEA